MQCEAATYQRCFSRAVEVIAPQSRTLYVSGTASIGQEGQSLHQGDITRQVEQTMQVVESLLKAQGMTWKDTSRAVAYFRRIEDEKVFEAYCRRHKLTALPVTRAWGDICREELLFEIEVDATVRT
jgi:enamine deaminase RidA (YjgF/YER057c/UK114 family)